MYQYESRPLAAWLPEVRPSKPVIKGYAKWKNRKFKPILQRSYAVKYGLWRQGSNKSVSVGHKLIDY